MQTNKITDYLENRLEPLASWGAGGEQTRAKSRVNFGFKFTRQPETRLNINAASCKVGVWTGSLYP